MTEIRTSRDHPSSMAERIKKRLDHSGGGHRAAETVQIGTGPTRTITAVHSRGQQQHNVRPRGDSK